MVNRKITLYWKMRTLAAIACYNERLAIGSVALLAREHVHS
jgi:hypothetical protein